MKLSWYRFALPGSNRDRFMRGSYPFITLRKSSSPWNFWFHNIIFRESDRFKIFLPIVWPQLTDFVSPVLMWFMADYGMRCWFDPWRWKIFLPVYGIGTNPTQISSYQNSLRFCIGIELIHWPRMEPVPYPVLRVPTSML